MLRLRPIVLLHNLGGVTKTMYNYAIWISYLVLAEILRRCCLALVIGFTGPLSKIPGPFLMRFSLVPWMLESSSGNLLVTVPKLFKTYGDCVRVGRFF